VRVFVAGAAGAIGRPLVQRLVAAGHEVTGTTRSPERTDAIAAAGATPTVVDALDADALAAAMQEARPEAIVHELTSLPHRYQPRRSSLYEATNRLRGEGTRNLLAGARAAGARRFVCQSLAFAYAPRTRPEVVDEDAPLSLGMKGAFAEGMRTVDEMERAVLEAEGMDGVVLRYGWFYGPGTYHAEDGSITREVRRRRFPVIGDGTGLLSFVHVDDAADATVAATERGAPGIYNVVDDDPGAMRDWLPAFAESIGAPQPRRVPVWLARLVAGPVAAAAAVQPGASNAKAKRELDWDPRWASWREGFREAPR
jgi:nucleoside-diphosphate-sugar epimerase